ncbi:MAG: ABC transporter permease [Oligoflexia bacterium]|nr:ABC transporter permease [Oligoflexia bacterium]
MLELRIAFRNILRQKRRSLFTGLALLVCFVLFSFIESITEGTYGHMIDLFTRDHTGHVQVHRRGYLDRPSISKAIDPASGIEAKLKEMREVVAFAPRVKGGGLAYAKTKTTPVQIIGIDPVREEKTSTLRQRLKRGQYLGAGAPGEGIRGAMIGQGVAENLKIDLGDELVLISQGADGSVANDRYRVEGVIGTMESSDQMNVYLTLPAAQEFFSLDGRVHELAVLLKHHSESVRFAAKLQGSLGAAEGGQALSIDPWQVVEEDFYRAMQTDRKGNQISKVILLVIVCIGVLNAVLMTILERTREYGVLKAVGTRPGRLFRLIVLEMGFLSLLSVSTGLVLAVPINYWFATRGISVPPVEVGGIPYDKMLGEFSVRAFFWPAVTIVVASVVVSLFPALKAVRSRVVDALRSN